MADETDRASVPYVSALAAWAAAQPPWDPVLARLGARRGPRQRRGSNRSPRGADKGAQKRARKVQRRGAPGRC